MTAQLPGLKPDGEHGFHVHDKGDCSSGDGMSAGGHFNPVGKAHGHQASDERHAGDMPNLGPMPTAMRALAVRRLPAQRADNVVGRGLIVHRDPDDYKTQPTGNAGPRMACAVIRQVSAESTPCAPRR